MPNLIVNADDFAGERGATDAILECFRRGWVNQTTLLVNTVDADRSVELAKKEGIADRIGLHFNVTSGTPLSKEMRSSVFCDDQGRFDGMRKIRQRMFLPFDRQTAVAVHAEAKAQIKRYLDYGLTLRHCDGHHHRQTMWPIARILLPLLGAYGFKSIRRPYNVGLGVGPGGVMRRARNCLFSRLAKRCGLHSTDFFVNPEQIGKLTPGCGSVEIMVHPVVSRNGAIIDLQDWDSWQGRSMLDVQRAICCAGWEVRRSATS